MGTTFVELVKTPPYPTNSEHATKIKLLKLTIIQPKKKRVLALMVILEHWKCIVMGYVMTLTTL